MQQEQLKKTGIKIESVASAVPSKVVKNQDLVNYLETSSSWIESRTGIKERRICDSSKKENSLSLSLQASLKALEKASLSPKDLDLILVATSTPDFLYPSTASRLQNLLQARQIPAFDLSAACSGFVFAFITACQFIQNKTYSKILLVGVDVHSRFIDWYDRSTAILFGDAAGALVLSAEQNSEQKSLLAFSLYSDGSKSDDLQLKCPNSKNNSPFFDDPPNSAKPSVSMNGRQIYQFAVESIPKLIKLNCQEAKIETSSIDYFVCHQANSRILNSSAQKLDLPSEKFLSNINKYGNTSAASIPLVLDEFQELIFQKGNLISILGFGAGLNWGGLIWRFN